MKSFKTIALAKERTKVTVRMKNIIIELSKTEKGSSEEIKVKGAFKTGATFII